MNSSGFSSNWNYDLFVKNHEDENENIFLTPEKIEHTVRYKVTAQLNEDISNYAYHRLIDVAQEYYSKGADWDKRWKLVKISELIVKDFEKIHKNRGFISKVIDEILVGLKLRPSENEIRKLHHAIKEPSLGDKISRRLASKLVDAHRHPKVLPETYDSVALTGVYFEQRFKELLEQNLEKIKGLKEPGLAIFKAQLKEQAIKDVYRRELPKRIAEGYYDPVVIPREVEKILGPKPNPAGNKFNAGNLYLLLSSEANKYAHHLTDHQLNYIKHDVIEAISLYLKAFPIKTYRNAFVLGCDLIRMAVYQEIFDKASFSGSDHGSKHIHHNIKNAESIHHNMQLHVDYSDKDRFLEHLIHFYHDIGYTVGLAGKSFACCKDHPFIGAKMIEENREYFEHHLDKESTDVLWNAVLLHAIAMPNLSPGSSAIKGLHPSMVRAVTSISDACAVTYDRKTQEFWEQPTTLLALISLRLFLTMYPQYIGKLSHSGKDEWHQLDKTNPMDIFAHDVFQHTKRILFKAVDRYQIPESKKELFRQAISQQFNSLTTAVTLGQFGAILTGVSAVINPLTGNANPKFLPQFGLAPSIIYGTLHDLFGEELAQASFKKLVDEFSGDLHVLAKEINETARKQSLAPSDSAKAIKTGNASFIIHKYDLVATNNEHFDQMQKALVQVANKINSVYHGKLVSLREKNKVVQELKAFRLGKSDGCTSFGDFVLEHVLPGLRTHQPLEAVKDIEKLTRLVKEDAFEEIRRADALWLHILEPLTDSVLDPIRADIDKYVAELEKLKIQITDTKCEETVGKMHKALVEAAHRTGRIEESGLGSKLDGIMKLLKENGLLFKTAEKRFLDIENAIKLSLVSEEEYLFMRGKKSSTSKGDCIAQLIEK